MIDYKAQYEEDLKDPRWKALVKKIRKRDRDRCQECGQRKRKGLEMNVHHLHYYPNRKPWEYEDDNFITLCRDCHIAAHERIEFESLKAGDCYIHKYFGGVGFLDGKQGDEILSSIWWAKDDSGGHLCQPPKFKSNDVRAASKEEIYSFWSKVAKKYDENFILLYLGHVLNKLPFEHPLWDRMRIRTKDANGRFLDALLSVHERYGTTLLVSNEDYAEFTNARQGALFDMSANYKVFPAAQFRITGKVALDNSITDNSSIVPYEDFDFSKFRAATQEEIDYYCQKRGISPDDLYSVLP